MTHTDSNVTCGRCGYSGHYSWQCRPDLDRRELEADLDAAERAANGPGASGVLYRTDPDPDPAAVRAMFTGFGWTVTEPTPPVAGIDYDPAVCDNCGGDEHTPAELAVCIASAIGEPRVEDDPAPRRRPAARPRYTNYFATLDSDIR